MKKILLASTVVLSIAGISKTTVLAEENQATNKVQSSEKTVANGTSKEAKEKKQAQGQEQGDKQNQNEIQNKAEKDSAQSTQKQETALTKDNSSTEEITEEVNKEGWQKENGQWRYYENKKAVKNWKKIAGVWYYFNLDGIMLSNTVFNDYLFNKSGALAESSWVKLENKWYYATEEGKVTRNKWASISGDWYRFYQDGIMLSNAIYEDYLFNSSGALAINTWTKIGDKWYYGNQDGKILCNKWENIKNIWYYFDQNGAMLSDTIYKEYLFDKSGALAESSWVKISNKWYYADASGKITEWIFDKQYNSWFYLKPDGTYAENQWQGSYYLKSGGHMAKSEWIFDNSYNAWYYLKEDGQYATGTLKIKGKDYSFENNGKWISNPSASTYYKVKPIIAYVYSASGSRLSYISQGSIVAVSASGAQGDRLPVQISGLSGFMNKSDLVSVNASDEFIPHYTSDGRYIYHELSPYTSIRVAPHSSSMAVGTKYYSADGINFDNFKLDNPFLYRDLRKPTNYTAAELDKVYSLMNINGSRLAGKGAVFKEAEKRYQVNALYLMAHSALESAWGRSQIAKDKNNFFGIAAYDTTPYDSAKSFDNVDKGILGAAKWIRENYIDEGRTHLGNKSSGMNTLYASDPYWGEKIASIMMTINSKLGEKD